MSTILMPTRREQGHFAVIGLQTDDSLFLANQPFVDLEGKELGKAKLLSKPLERITVQTPLIFNGGLIKITKIGNKFSNIELTQERQASRIKTVPISARGAKRMSTLHNALEGLILLQLASWKPLSTFPMQHRPPI